MQFKLRSLSEAFSLNSAKNSGHYFLYAFILGASSDKLIFPELLSYYPEIDQLTGSHILVIGPNLLPITRRRADSSQDEATDLLTLISEENREAFLERQTKESIAFARVCNVRLNQLPCILFFDTLQNPYEYILWNLKSETATSVVQGFRTIITEIESKFAEDILLKKKLGKQKRNRKENLAAQKREQLQNSKKLAGIATRITELSSRKKKLLHNKEHSADSVELNSRIEDTLKILTDYAEKLEDEVFETTLRNRIIGLRKYPFNTQSINFIYRKLESRFELARLFDDHLSALQEQPAENDQVRRQAEELADRLHELQEEHKKTHDQDLKNRRLHEAIDSDIIREIHSIEARLSSISKDELYRPISKLNRAKVTREVLELVNKSIPFTSLLLKAFGMKIRNQ